MLIVFVSCVAVYFRAFMKLGLSLTVPVFLSIALLLCKQYDAYMYAITITSLFLSVYLFVVE
jgi:hypothetical protein